MNTPIHKLCALCLLLLAPLTATSTEPNFPVTPEVLVEGVFPGCEGIAFNGEGRLFVTGGKALWEINTDGTASKLTELLSNLGLAGYGEKDLLVADFGATNAFRHQKNQDGIIWRISPEGQKQPWLANAIGDPNFILVRNDASILVSDDVTNEVFLIHPDQRIELFTTAVNHPNGLALSDDGRTLFVAQIFSSIKPIVADNKLWSINLNESGHPIAAATLALALPDPKAAPDGLVMDVLGRVYIAANNAGQVWRFDPKTRSHTLIAEGVFGAASMAFGEGAFDHESIYLTTTYAQNRGGKVYRIPVGVKGQVLHR
ncbi:SMP-30/gluconolactonase/LRE family protein [Marinicella meishanensis]|uniref:SMP-30/gluconolactonase/LRE family protein n=1 Tax=Marinicella meishanensis TaxID=2873263 RepID=UPI001CBC2950|nr:SMP-30/gluconolactonase/LRE family protein [Marinicella sp. NBU2979]